MVSRALRASVASLLFALAGCASAPADWGRGDATRLAAERGRSVPDAAARRALTERALAAPLTADAAVQLALLHNPDLRLQAAQLGVAAAELHDAARLSNPTFSLTRLSGDSSAGANVPQLTLGIAFNFLNLLFLPSNTRFADAQMEAAKLQFAGTVMDLAANVEAAWYEAVGAEQLAQMRDAVRRAQRASADLTQRFFEAGNLGARELAMERAAASQATLAAISARAQAVTARLALNRRMGLPAESSDWTLDARLAEPPEQAVATAELQRLALESRMDVLASRRRAQAIADRFGLVRATRWINGLEVGAERERDFDGALDAGPTLSIELPLFNWGGRRAIAIRAALGQAEAELDGRVLDVSNAVAQSAARVESQRALAREYRDALVPARDAIVSRLQEEQNYMLVGVFEVLAARQQSYEAYAGYIEAVRDFWVARSELTRAVGRRLPDDGQSIAPTIDADALLHPKRPAAEPTDGSGEHHVH